MICLLDDVCLGTAADYAAILDWLETASHQRPSTGRGTNLRARPESIGAVSAVDVEDVTRHEFGFVRSQENNAVSDLIGESEPT